MSECVLTPMLSSRAFGWHTYLVQTGTACYSGLGTPDHLVYAGQASVSTSAVVSLRSASVTISSGNPCFEDLASARGLDPRFGPGFTYGFPSFIKIISTKGFVAF